ncbi:cbb3-type cytochrome c oxidase subunit II [Microvirga pakistanensis]|uniref:cbb3-type cytochrome c oxidase subunit II n=1 Tax=Microvirga pakistanensis TaxID=1682650 RepID=UPI003CC7F87B
MDAKRIGPDLARVGKRYFDDWHRDHLKDLRAVVPGSIMPSYLWLKKNEPGMSSFNEGMKIQAMLGVPYAEEMLKKAESDARI